MGSPMDEELDFKSQFYNLQGIHINERKKNLHKLLKSTSPDVPDDQIDIQPRNYQENVFYVDVLIHFKKVEKLTEILKGGIGVLASKILKQQWFFREAFKHMTEEDLVTKFLPALSKSLRMKVLKKLSLILSEERMDTIFDLVLERYGLFIAKQFLFSCSAEKIVLVLKTNEITLFAEQLKRLLQKDVNLLKVYIEEYKKNMRRDFDDYDFLNYLAWKHPHLYFEFGLNNEGLIKLGRYTSRAIIKNNKETVLKDIKNSRLNKAALVREVKDFDKEYLHLFFPRDLRDLNYSTNVQSLVSKYPIKKRWEVFSQAFKQTYNGEIVEHLGAFEEALAKFFPEKIQQKWAEIKYLDSDDLKYIKYCEPKKAFKLLKDKINVTSDISQRGRLLNELITVCYTNKDYSTYEEVLQYICVRHRNDDKNVRLNMIHHMKNNIDYNLITEVHWKYLNEIIDIQRVRGDYLPFELITEYLLFLHRNKLPLDGPVTQYVKDCLKYLFLFRLQYLDCLKEPEAESTILKLIVKILPTIEYDNRKQVTYDIMSSIIEFNKEIKTKAFKKEFKNTWIDLNECTLIMDLIKEVFTKQEPYENMDYEVVKSIIPYNCLYSDVPLKDIDEKRLLNIVKIMAYDNNSGYMVNSSILEVVKKSKRNDFENTLLDYFFNTTKEDYYYLKQDAVKYFLTKEPEVIAKYFDIIVPLDVKSYCDILDYNIIKKYSHLGLCKKVIDHFKALVSVDSKYDKKTKLLNGLSRVMNTKDFLDLVKDYTPTEKKLDLNNDMQKELYQVQCDVAKAFRNLDEVSILAPVLMHFSQGDYLQSSLGALYRVLYRINEEQAYSYINVLGMRAMSTRKHAVFLGLELLSVKDAMTLYSELSNKESNISAKKYLFDAVLKYFIKSPLENVLDIVFLNMNFVDKNDTEMIQTLVDAVNKIINKYKPLFIEKVWNLLDILEQQGVKVTGFKNKLLHFVNGHGTSFILMLNKNFCENTITKYFLSSDDSLQNKSDDIDNFVINYLLAYLDETHFQYIFNIIITYKSKYWGSNRTYIFRFFSNAYEKFDENDVIFLKLFTSSWQHLFSHVESFTQYTMLRLMEFYKKNTDLETFSKEVDKFFQELLAEYGPYISELLIKSIKSLFSNIPTKHNTYFNLGNFTYHLLQSNSSELNCFIAFNIIQNFCSTGETEIYLKVVGALKPVTNLTAKIYYNALNKRDNTSRQNSSIGVEGIW